MFDSNNRKQIYVPFSLYSFRRIWLHKEQYSTVLANRKFTRIVTYTVNYWFSAWPDRHLKSCHILDNLAPIWYLIEIFKKIRHVFLPQGTRKLQDVKVESLLKVYFCAVNQTLQNLTDCNFSAPCGTKTCHTFLKTSNQY